MYFKAASAVALLAIAGQASASEPVPYKPLMKMSVHQLFGMDRRQSSGYQPTQTICGSGTTCAEACGADFVQCASKDSQTHCFEPSQGQICCPDGSGNSCDAGYYCTQDTTGQTWCCPDGQTLAQCAAAYSITGSLISETLPASTSTASSASITSSASYGSNATVTTDIETDTVTTCPSAGTSLSYHGSNATVKATPTASVAQVPVSGAGLVIPSTVSALVIAVGVFAVALY